MAGVELQNLENTKHLKHLAIQIVAQLPEDAAEALAVLEHAKNLITVFLDGRQVEAVASFSMEGLRLVT